MQAAPQPPAASRARRAVTSIALGFMLALVACSATDRRDADGHRPAERALLRWLQASQRAGFERHDLPAYLAAFAPEATLTVARGEAPGPYDRTLIYAQLVATRQERFFAPAPQPARLRWTEARVAIDGDHATIRWVAHSETPDGEERVAERYDLRRARAGETPGFLISHNRLWPLWQMDGRRLPIAFDAPTWAQRDADVLRHRCDGGPCPEVLLAAWRFGEAYDAARDLAERTPDTHAQAATRWLLRGVCAVVSGHVEDAAPSFTRALRLNPALTLPPWRSAAAAKAAIAHDPLRTSAVSSAEVPDTSPPSAEVPDASPPAAGAPSGEVPSGEVPDTSPPAAAAPSAKGPAKVPDTSPRPKAP